MVKLKQVHNIIDYMDMSKIKWSGYKWQTRERWGDIHPDKAYVWYDPKCVKVDNWGYAHLETHYNPRVFPNIGESKYGVGLLSSVDDFDYGYFEIEAKLPSAKKIWPAFWLWASDSWPPEIDIFEGYTNDDNSYLNPSIKTPLGFWNVVPNFHYNQQGVIKSTGTKQKYWGFKDPSKHFIKYSCLWTSDLIEIKYDGHLIKRITDKGLLKYFTGMKMRVIINNQLKGEPNNGEDQYSDFVVKYFKYEKN